jgi:hypothetical protein
METTWSPLQRRDVDMDVDVGTLPTHLRGLRAFEKSPGQIAEGVGTTMRCGPIVSLGRRRHESVHRSQESLTLQGG